MTTTEMTTTSETFDILLEKIAQKHFYGVETLETQNSDSLDFHDVAVWSIRSALEDAFKAGMELGLTINN
jgi:hypothetical protein